MEGCVKGTENEQRIIALERDMSELKEGVNDIKNGLLKRPSWSVTVIITILTAISCSSITFACTIIRMALAKG